MADRMKVLAQVAVAATTLTDIYTCAGDTGEIGAHIYSVYIANRTGGAITVRVSVAIDAAADDNKQYIVYGKSIAANDILKLQNITMGKDDVLRVYATDTVSVGVFGVEIRGAGDYRLPAAEYTT